MGVQDGGITIGVNCNTANLKAFGMDAAVIKYHAAEISRILRAVKKWQEGKDFRQ